MRLFAGYFNNIVLTIAVCKTFCTDKKSDKEISRSLYSLINHMVGGSIYENKWSVKYEDWSDDFDW